MARSTHRTADWIQVTAGPVVGAARVTPSNDWPE
jgi:hypothetical protein